MSVFEGSSVSLRALEPDDLQYLYLWENDTDIWWLGNTLKPYSKETLRKYLNTAHLDIHETRQVRFAVYLNENPVELVGLIDLYDFDPHHKRAGVGILMGETKNRGKGYGSEALKILCNYAFTLLDLHQLYCSIPETNLASIKLFNNKGFIQTGLRPDWIKTKDGWAADIFFQLSSKEWVSRTE